MARGRHPHAYAVAGAQAVIAAIQSGAKFGGAVNQPKFLTCDMKADCQNPVTHIGAKGYLYCTPCASHRHGVERTRALTAREISHLEQGRTLRNFNEKPKDPICEILKRTYYA